MNLIRARSAVSVCFLLFVTGCAHHSRVSVTSSTAPTIQGSSPSLSLTTKRVGPNNLYPDFTLTPGEADTLVLDDLTKRYTDNCPNGRDDCTYSQSHRKVPKAIHTQVYDEYHVPANERNFQHGEVDHFYPMCAGGSNNIANLWFQPAENKWKGKNFGFKEKDQLEAWICVQIKAGELDPKLAFVKITHDWVAFYLDEHLDEALDGDDEDVD